MEPWSHRRRKEVANVLLVNGKLEVQLAGSISAVVSRYTFGLILIPLRNLPSGETRGQGPDVVVVSERFSATHAASTLGWRMSLGNIGLTAPYLHILP
jgi:hypothetical protein